MFAKILFAFIAITIAEFFLFLKISDVLSFWTALGLILAAGIFGTWLSKQQSRLAMQKFREATAQGKMPTTEILDGLIIFAAGIVLLTPGFLTDLIGFSLLVPKIRQIVRAYLTKYLQTKLQVRNFGFPSPKQEPAEQARRVEGKVIDV